MSWTGPLHQAGPEGRSQTRFRIPCSQAESDLRGACSRRINIQHRLVYQVLEEERIVKVLRLWSHYE